MYPEERKYVNNVNNVNNEKIRGALTHKVRAVERKFCQVKEVYYKCDGDKGSSRGPSTLLRNRGSVHYLVHNENIIRVAS